MNQQDEIWKDVTGYEGFYMVSNNGNIKRLDRHVFNKANGTNSFIKGQTRKPDTLNKKYAQISLCKDGATKKFLIHRLVAIAFIPNPENLSEVNHIDHDKLNNNDSNLEWVTRSQNAAYAKKMGRYANMLHDESHPCSILNIKSVRHIRQKVLRNRDYCKLYGVSPSTITAVQKSTTLWKDAL